MCVGSAATAEVVGIGVRDADIGFFLFLLFFRCGLSLESSEDDPDEVSLE